ncbi:hypothetical protein L198_02104 [Cryptococcus wingfieldii CBS 7118]|uniref:Uncharacterized protein n=1 Tax=Cryptococcus wingfieldii CBS 7118 TaxID=1295528 RepID=A0A1E3JX61_9TREE|nr:hypothetical protein L198_02104 [Cryptococcus wingfieldii CBS 7118]ODO05411.1 hypothetical protein L198_02104 [Cryptococcus wingfieldii CBS 7118]
MGFHSLQYLPDDVVVSVAFNIEVSSDSHTAHCHILLARKSKSKASSKAHDCRSVGFKSGKRLKLDASPRETLAQLAKMSHRELLVSSILESLEAQSKTKDLNAKIEALTNYVAIPLTQEIKPEVLSIVKWAYMSASSSYQV